MTRRLLLILLTLAVAFPAAAQSTRIRGKVTDARTGEPLPFVGI